MEKPREIAIRVLQRWETSNRFIEDVLEAELDRVHVSPADRRLLQEIVFGLVRWRAVLDWLIAQRTADRPQNLVIRLLLRLGLYQMFWLDRIPDYAIVHQTVELAKRLGSSGRAGFVNAVLRGCLREQPAIAARLEELKSGRPALGFSHPEWLYDRWLARWGDERARRLMAWNNTPARIFARANLLRADHNQLLARWRAEGVDCAPFRKSWFPEHLVFELKNLSGLASLPSFQQGLFYVQDPSTLLAVEELDPQPGDEVLDLCSAPGGKTTLIAQKMQNHGKIIAADTEPGRLTRLWENCARLGVSCVEKEQPIPGASPAPRWDRVLVDAPCSNTGVMRRRVDLRWRIRPEELDRLRQIQLDLLERAAAQLKLGGTLVYSTCSLEPEENRHVVGQFLAEHSCFQLERERELLPFVDEVDGAYVARIRKAI